MDITGVAKRRSRRARFIVAAALAALAAPRIATAAADFSPVWNGGTGNWNDATQWTPAVVPNNGAQTYDATLSAGDATLAGNVTIQKLTLGGSARVISPTGTPFQITANELFTWDTAGRVTNSLIVANGGVSVTGTAASPTLRTDRLTLTIPATKSFTSLGGNIGLMRSTFNNNGTMHFTTATTIVPPGFTSFDTNTINNTGTINVSSFTNLQNTALNNSGTINFSAGTLWLSGGGTWTAGSATGNGSIKFAGFFHTLDAASTIADTISIEVSGGDVLFNSPLTRSSALTLIGDQFGAASATFMQPVTFTAGGGGSLWVLKEGTASFRAGATINQPVMVRGRLSAPFAPILAINGELTLDGGSVSNAIISASWSMTNRGTSGVGAVISNAPLTQAGAVSVGGGFTNNSTITGGGTYTGTGTLLNNGSIAGANFSFGPSLTLSNAAAGAMNLTGATTFSGVVHNHGPITTGASVSNTGVFAQYSGAALTLAAGAGTFTSSAGVLRAHAAGPADAGNARTAGTFTLNGNLVMNAPGSTPARLEVELGGTTQGTQYDFYDINGSASIVAALDIRFLNDFDDVISPSDVFTILSADAPLTGSIQNPWLGGPAGRVITADGLGSFLVSFSGNNLVLSDFSTAVPEPTSAAIVTGALVAAATTARQRRRSCRG